MQAIYNQALPPSGHEHAISLRLTPKTVLEGSYTLRNLVLARTNKLEIFDVVLLGASGQEARLQHIASHTVHGIVTGLERVRTLDTAADGRHRLLVAFRDAKLSLMEWSPEAEELVPVSLHSYERLPEVVYSNPSHWSNPRLRADPLSRCAALQLPTREATLALLPLFQDALDLPPDSSLPYAPSTTLALQSLAPDMIHLIDYTFLHGFTEPTIAVLYTPYPTWAGRIDLPGTRDNVCLVMVTLDLTTLKHTIISHTRRLPFDAHSVVSCPKELGGALVLSGNALIHVDQSSKVVGTALNGWHARTSSLPVDPPSTSALKKASDEAAPIAATTENSYVTFLTPLQALLFHTDGGIFHLSFSRDGRSVTKLSLKQEPLATGSIPSAAERVGREFIYTASAVGPGLLLRWSSGDSNPTGQLENGAVAVNGNSSADAKMGEVHDEEEDDLYGSSAVRQQGASNGAGDEFAPESLILSHQDTLDAYGPIRSLTVGLVDSDTQPELVAATGAINIGSLTVFHRGISPRRRRKLEVQMLSQPCISSWKLADSTKLFLSSRGNKKTMTANISNDGAILYGEEEGDVLAAGSMMDGALNVKVSCETLHYGPSDGSTSLQGIHLGSQPPIDSAQIIDGMVLVRREGGVSNLYQADDTVISSKPVSLSEPDATSDMASIFADSQFQLPLFRQQQAHKKPSMEAETNGAVGDEEAVDYEDDMDDLYNKTDGAGPSKSSARDKLPRFSGVRLGQIKQQRKRYYLATCSKEGCLRISAMPERQLLFQNQSLRYLPNMICNEETASEPVQPLEDTEVESISLFELGKERPVPALGVLLVNGTLAIYKATWNFAPGAEEQSPKPALAVRFVKVATRNVDFHRMEECTRRLQPTRTPSGHHGLFVNGSEPIWALASDHGPTHILDCHQGPTLSLHSPIASRFVAYATTADELTLAEIAPACYDSRLPWQTINEGKTYTNVVFDRPSETFVGAALYRVPFQNYEEAKPVFQTDDPAMQHPEPKNHRSTIEVMVPGSWEVLDGYEFRPNESVLCMQNVRLESKSTPSGFLDVIAVGTTISRSEDVSVRGALYVFEVLNTNPDPSQPQRARRLRLRSVEDQKSSVAHLCEINGYLCHCVGLKLYIKGFDLDERLLSLAFLDIGIHTTSIRALKNFIILGDVNKGITFVAFQEDPFKLQPLGRDQRGHGTSTADFLIHDGKLAFVTTDRSGVLRLLEYNPFSIETRAGERLLNRTEMRMATEVADVMTFSKRVSVDEPAKQSGILQAGMDGSLYSISPTRDIVYKRLQLLERQLQRHGGQFGGLNPRGFRTVPNYHVSRPLAKGLLDGDLLAKFWRLHTLRQAEMAEAANSDPDTIAANLASICGPW